MGPTLGLRADPLITLWAADGANLGKRNRMREFMVFDDEDTYWTGARVQLCIACVLLLPPLLRFSPVPCIAQPLSCWLYCSIRS